MHCVTLIIGYGRVRVFSYVLRLTLSDDLHVAHLRSRGVYIGEESTVITTSFLSEKEADDFFLELNYKIKASRFILKEVS